MIKDKRSQFYILTTLLLVSTLYGIGNLIDIKDIGTDSYKDTPLNAINYRVEANNIINNAILEDKKIDLELSSMTKEFILFNKRKQVDIGILYILKYDNKLHIKNFLNQEIDIIADNITLKHQENAVFDVHDLIIRLKNRDTIDFEFNDLEKELKFILIEKNNI